MNKFIALLLSLFMFAAQAHDKKPKPEPIKPPAPVVESKNYTPLLLGISALAVGHWYITTKPEKQEVVVSYNWKF